MLGLNLGLGFTVTRRLLNVGPPLVNLVPDSDALVLWTATGATITQYVETDQSGEASLSRIFEFAATSSHNYTSANIAFTSGNKYTLSCHAMYDGTRAHAQILLGGAAFGVNAYANFNIQTGVLGTVGSAASAAITHLGGGVYRISITATATATTNAPVSIAIANSATLGRAASYAGVATNSILVGKAQVVEGESAGSYKSTAPTLTFTGNTDDTKVGAIRWDAWHHPTQDTIRTAMETSLGAYNYHWRLPFFAETPTSSSAVIDGDQAAMDAEIDYAVECGLDYWAFFYYGASSTNGMNNGLSLFQASAKKNNLNWCLYFSGVTTFSSEVANNLSGIVAYMQQSNYQLADGYRPLIFVYDDAGSKATLAADIASIRQAATGAGLQNPYIAFHQSTADGTIINTYGFDATTRYSAPVTATGAQSFAVMDTATRNLWNTQAAQSNVVPMFTLGWDRRPRVENTVPWESPAGSINDYFYPIRVSAISTHLDACLAWVRANPSAAPANVVIGYAWNENDEGGWIVPTKASNGDNDSHLLAVKNVLTLPQPDPDPEPLPDPIVVFQLTSMSVVEDEPLSVSLNKFWSGACSVDWDSSDGQSGTVSFTSSQSLASFNITFANPGAATITLSNPVGCTVGGDATADVTVSSVTDPPATSHTATYLSQGIF